MDTCIFCMIVSGKFPSAKWWENEDFIAILDINPNIKGASLFIPKTHEPSDIADASTITLTKAIKDIKQPINILKKHFNTPRVGVVVEGVGVNHLHFKLYPFIGFEEGQQEDTSTVHYDKYPGFISTKLGPKVEMEDLEELAKLLRS